MLEAYFDMFVTLASIYISYLFSMLFTPPSVDFLSHYTIVGVVVVTILSSLTYQALNLYHPIIMHKRYSVTFEIIRANVIYYGLVAFAAAVLTNDSTRVFLLVWTLICAILSSAFLIFKRHIMRDIVRALHKKQFHLKKVIIIGNNAPAAKEYVKNSALESGCMVLGYVGDNINEDIGCDKLGSLKDAEEVIAKQHPTDVVFAVSSFNKKALIRLVNFCEDRCIKVYFLPVIYGFFKTSRQVEQLGSLPVINIHTTPLDNTTNALIKRAIDVVGSLALIILTLPIMLFAAIGVYITSPGPVIFRQKRVGKMGKVFTMLKFRSMRLNTDSNKAWTTGADPRKTKFGTFIRKYAIDELPQLFNVLFGSMSLVGPRPEIPHFVEHFKNEIPLYMVKHYVKPGMTGLAQIKGLRGDTSVEERIHEDIAYIENWSLGLDLYILLQTPLKAINKSEKYVGSADEQLHADEHGEVIGENRQKKVLYIASTYQHIEAYHTPYINALRERGYRVFTMANGEGADYNIPFEKKMFSPKNLLAVRKIKAVLHNRYFDYAITNTSLAAFFFRLATPKKGGPKVINLVHGYLFSEGDCSFKAKLLRTAEKLVRKKTDTVIVMNEEDRLIAEKYSLAKGGVKFVRGMGVTGKEATLDPCELRRELGCEDRFVLTFVGELSARKNQEFLIECMPALKERIPNAVLWLVGDGKEEENLRALAAGLGVGDEVFFLGRRSDPENIINATDLYVSASRSEGLPFNIVEALHKKKTTVASRVKGHTDIIEDGVSGVLFTLGDKADFVEKIAAVHGEQLALDGERILERYVRYSFDEVYPETLATYLEELEI